MGRKSKFQKGVELGERYPVALRMDKMFNEGRIKGKYLARRRRQRKKAVPKKHNKRTRQEFEAGFRIGMRRGQ